MDATMRDLTPAVAHSPIPSVFDSHFHIIDYRFPLIPNDGYKPESFICADYLERMEQLELCGGAVVSGSFQGFDQSYLLHALDLLGPSFVGVTQLPASVSDAQIEYLHSKGVRAVRFNLRRGGSEHIGHLPTMAARIYEIAGWHVELYIDSDGIAELCPLILTLPMVSIDHLGLDHAGLKLLIRLAERGVGVKATGFGRLTFGVKEALQDLYSANPGSLIFGSDLPSTRAARPYSHRDLLLVIEALGFEESKDVLSRNALDLYNVAGHRAVAEPYAAPS